MSAYVASALAAVAIALAMRSRATPPDVHVPRAAWLVPVAALAGALPVLLSGRRLVLALVVGGVVLAVAQHTTLARTRRAAEGRAEQVLLACDGLAADLAAGQPPTTALDRAAREWPELAPVAAAAGLGADVPDAMRRVAVLPGAGQLAVVAAAWQVAHRSGTGLAATVARAARALRDERSTRRAVLGHLASARATARLLAVLPLVFLLLGSGLGADPVAFLLGTPVGLGCLAVGAALAHLGVLWLDRIAARVLA